MSRTITRVPFLRRFYIRRMIRFIDKAHARNRPLPPDMVQLDQFLSQVPVKDRESALEAAILADREGTGPSRDMRRLAEKQARQSGRGGGRQRPGSPPRPRNAPRPR
ncbi:MAG TPA: hypothetical protein VFP54_09165 [Acidimicrobiales bacterium]|nr:hypothetical protein [Acidimicrobiales bacterium]